MDRVQITPLLDTLRLEKISDETYFSEKYSNYISNSRLSLINPEQDGSEEKFFEGFKPIYSSSLSLGSAVHGLSLQPEFYTMCNDCCKPTGKAGFIADKYYPHFKDDNIDKELIYKIAAEIDYYNGILSEKQYSILIEKCLPYWHQRSHFEASYLGSEEVIYLDPKSRETACMCVESLSNNPYVQRLLHPKGLIEDPISENEQAILLDVEININDEKFILRLKSKLDNYTIDKESNVITINDVKTLGRKLELFQSNIDNYHYHRELSMYSWLLSLCAEKFYNMKTPTIRANYLVVSTIPNYCSGVTSMNKEDFRKGWNEFSYLLKLVALAVYKNHKNFGIWK